MNLEFLAHKWKLINTKKYSYRSNFQLLEDRELPQEALVQCHFDIQTLKLAFHKVNMSTLDGQELLIDKEFALAGAKLI